MKRSIVTGFSAFTLGAFTLGACGGGSNNGVDAPKGADASTHDGPTHDGPTHDGHLIDGPPGTSAAIFTIVLENHDYAEIVGSSNAPYINSLINQYGLATNY